MIGTGNIEAPKKKKKPLSESFLSHTNNCVTQWFYLILRELLLFLY